MISQRNLSLLSNRRYKEHGGRRIPEAVLERDYCLAWFLIGLSQSKLKVNTRSAAIDSHNSTISGREGLR